MHGGGSSLLLEVAALSSLVDKRYGETLTALYGMVWYGLWPKRTSGNTHDRCVMLATQMFGKSHELLTDKLISAFAKWKRSRSQTT